MRTNFEIKSFTEIEFEGKLLDLHNNFSFVSDSFDKNQNALKLSFKKASGNWVPQNELKNLTFIFAQINYLKAIAPKPENAEDDHCLAGITFFNSEDRMENYSLTEKPFPGPDDDIIFTFESDRVFRINCEAIKLIAE
ncbi:MAG: hypothetical protein IAF38_14360 [Bacteroidia bacterium]|nr:hypothetical protein [Bacteroidia bacterium]